MNRKELIKTCHLIIKDLCDKYGYSFLVTREDREKGLWGHKFTEFLEKEYGECTHEFCVFKNKDDKSSHFEFRFRFDSPCISFYFHEEKDGRSVESLAEIEFHTSTYIPSGEFYKEDTGFFKKGNPIKKRIDIPAEISEVILWNPESSMKYYLEMKDLFDKYNKNSSPKRE